MVLLASPPWPYLPHFIISRVIIPAFRSACRLVTHDSSYQKREPPRAGLAASGRRHENKMSCKVVKQARILHKWEYGGWDSESAA
jgi:hypothetical protein